MGFLRRGKWGGQKQSSSGGTNVSGYRGGKELSRNNDAVNPQGGASFDAQYEEFERLACFDRKSDRANALSFQRPLESQKPVEQTKHRSIRIHQVHARHMLDVRGTSTWCD